MIIVDGDKLHSELQEDKAETFYVAEGIGLYLKVSLKDRQPPLTLNFQYENPKDNKLVKAYYSSEFIRPRDRGTVAEWVSQF